MSFLAERTGLRLADHTLVVCGCLLSLTIVMWVSESVLVTMAYGGGLLALGALAIFISRHKIALQASDHAVVPDWALTAAAIADDHAGLAITDHDGRMLCGNPLFNRWFGGGCVPPRLALDDDYDATLQLAARAARRDGEAHQRVCRGQEIWDVTIKRAGRGDDYLIWRFTKIGVSHPVEGMKERLTSSVGRMFSQAAVEIVLVGADGAIRAVTPGFAKRAGADSEADLTGQDFVALLRTDEREQIYFAREGRSGSPQILVRVPLSDPEMKSDEGDGELSLMLLFDSAVGIGVQGTDQGQAPELEALLEKLPLGLAMTNKDGYFLFANPAFHRAAGLGEEELPSYPSDLVIQEDKGALSNAVRRYSTGATGRGDVTVRLRSEPDEPVSFGIAAVRGLGEATILLSIADSSEETRLRRQVAQATKMQAVGQLAGGVAHDFNNVLTAIIGYCDLMLLRHLPGDSDYDDIQQIKANSNRAASLTRQLLAFSRQQTLRPEVVQLPDVLSEVSQLLKRLLGAKITLKIHHARGLGPVRADPRQLEQVIINLAVNARDAIQSNGRDGEQTGGTLSFCTRAVSRADIERLESDIIPVGEYTALIAEDTGGGISPEALGKIFEPFFTTKEQGKGTGLGLSTVYGIVKQSGGFVFADNVTDAANRITGARFTVYLPIHNAPTEIQARQEPEPASRWSGGGHILLVEDEDMVRAVAERALLRQGYEVTAARDGDEGLEHMQPGRFDLVISDVVMPTMDGPAMAREIRKIEPELPILFMSGYAEEQLRSDIDIDRMHFLPKPFSVQQIAAKVSQILSQGPHSDQ
ncbi:response regulator [Altericroceibacterium endophyticum]|uniref:histidine kinase n=1 Tax=Altericroceibacterium endophyticum TaxID=1808508 RepID=A0A6I4T1Y7_9SPHN|nr:response regulator [Altericroceibacterium endophyticum]MXO64362.1 response regulator [Altericroceibacterium endophyticum]